MLPCRGVVPDVADEICFVLRGFLLQCGDVEESPGDMSLAGQKQLNDMLALLCKIKENSTSLCAGQESNKADIKNILHK